MTTTYGLDKQKYSVSHFNIINRTLLENHITYISKSKYSQPLEEIRIETDIYYFKKCSVADKDGCTLTIYSVSSGTNIAPITGSELKNRLKLAIHELKTMYGIEILKKDLRLYTSEINANIRLENEYEKYTTLLEAISGSVAKKKKGYKSDALHKDSKNIVRMFLVSSSNGNKKYKYYDKKSEVFKNDNISISDELLRLEQETDYHRRNKSYDISEITTEEIREEIYKNMILPYLQEMEWKQQELEKLLKAAKEEVKYFSKSAKEKYIYSALASTYINVTDILEILFCIYSNNSSKNKARDLKQLKELYKDLYNIHYNDRYNNHILLKELLLKMEYPIPELLELQLSFLN